MVSVADPWQAAGFLRMSVRGAAVFSIRRGADTVWLTSGHKCDQAQCPSRVKSDGLAMSALLPLYPRKPTFIVRGGMSQKCQQRK